MRVLIAQLEPSPGSVTANAERICAALEEYPNADLAVFPELFLSGYFAGQEGGAAVLASDAALSMIAEQSRQMGTAVMTGFAERHNGGLANSVACITRKGELAAIYRKAQLFGAGEKAAFTPGNHLVVTDLNGCKIGPLICFDVEFPELARAVSVAGAELLVTMAGNMLPYGPEHALHARARALENRRHHIYVNLVGLDGDLRFVGESCVIGPDGTVLHQLGGDPEMLCVDLNLDLARWNESEVNYLPQIRNLSVQKSN